MQDAQPKLETENETEVFDSMWDDAFVPTEPVPDQTCRMPSAPSGPAASATALTTERASPPKRRLLWSLYLWIAACRPLTLRLKAFF